MHSINLSTYLYTVALNVLYVPITSQSINVVQTNATYRCECFSLQRPPSSSYLPFRALIAATGGNITCTDIGDYTTHGSRSPYSYTSAVLHGVHTKAARTAAPPALGRRALPGKTRGCRRGYCGKRRFGQVISQLGCGVRRFGGSRFVFIYCGDGIDTTLPFRGACSRI